MRKKFWGSLLTVFTLAVLLALFAAFSVSAATVNGTFSEEGASVQWSLDTTTGTLTISGTGEMADASLQSVAPWYDYHDTIQGVVVSSGVTSIGNYAFRDCSALTSVSIATSVAEIGDYAFTRCTSLTAISIPSGVKSLGNGAFSFCSSLATVSISKGLESVGSAAFIYCGSIESISVDSGNSAYYSSGNCLIEKDTQTLVLGCKNSTIPSAVQHIDDYAFHYCLGLTAIDIPENVSSIGVSAFQYCKALVSVTFPDGLSDIGGWAFAGCSSLETVELPEAITKIEEYTFCYCPALSNVQIPKNVILIGTKAFYFCSSLTEIILPSHLGNLGGYAFNGCASLENVTFLSKFTVISNYAIDSGSALSGYAGSTAETFANNNGNVFSAFEGNTSDDGLTWSLSPGGNLLISGAGAMSDYAQGTAPWYSYRADIVSVSVEKGVTNIGSYAFYGLSSLTDVWLASSVTSVGEYAFANCTALKEIELPKSVATVEAGAFNACSSLTDIHFLSAYTEIAQSADTIYAGATLRGYSESTAKDYADQFGRNFSLLARIQGVGSDGLSWELKNTGELVLSGEGDMADYQGGSAPWLPSAGGMETFDNVADDSLMTTILNDDSALSGFFASVGNNGGFSVVSDGTGKYIRRTASSSATIYLLDSTGFINNEKFVIAFDYRMESTPNSAGILSLNNRSAGSSDEMRILSTQSGQNAVYFGMVGSNGVKILSDLDSSTWVSFCVVVDPLTYDYEVYVDGKQILYTETNAAATGGHYVHYLSGDEWATTTISGTQSPFTNVDGMIKGVYMFHTSQAECSIDNLYIKPLSDVKKVTIDNGVTSVGANAFRYCTDLTSVSIPLSVSAIGDSAFYATDIERIDLLLKDVAIYDSARTLPVDAVLYGPSGSTLEAYAETYGRQFVEVVVSLAEGTCGDGLTWVLDSDRVLTISGNGAMYDYENGSAPWYEYLSNLQTVVIEEGVTSVGANAFRSCTEILSFTLPSSVKSIGDYAFAGLQITSISLPSGLQSLGQGAFLDCAMLSEISLPNAITTIEVKTFFGCEKLANVIFPTSLTAIDAYAFADCKALTEITIPATVTDIGEAAFRNCDNLVKMTFNAKATVIYDSADTLAKTTVIYGYGGSTAQSYADKYAREFVMVNAVASESFGDGLTWTITDDNILIIRGKGSIPNYYSPNTAPWVESYGDTVTSVVIGEGITAVGAYAFQKHSALETISLPSTLTDIYAGGFAHCKSLVRVDIPENVEKLGAYAFYGCSSLTDIYFYSLGTTINNSSNALPKTTVIHCFANANVMSYAKKYDRVTKEFLLSLGSGQCGDNVTWELFAGGRLVISGEGAMADYSLASPAPWNDSSLEEIRSIKIEEGVTTVGAFAFRNLPLVTEISLPASVTTIGISGFAFCRGLTEINIPATIEYIGSYAFYACLSLKDMYFDSTKTLICSSANTLPVKTVIRCSSGSFAATYANKFDRTVELIVVLEDEGFCGNGLTWKMYSDGRLVISGEGAMTDYSASARAPWFNKYSAKIRSVIVEEGVTSVGAYAFQGHSALASVSLPSSITKIGISSFALCKGLAEIEIPAAVANVNAYAFYGCSAMADIYFNSGDTLLASASTTLPVGATIHCAYGSAAHIYANKFDRTVDAAVVVECEEAFGDALSWKIYSDGLLVISGEGAIPDYSTSSRAPWYSNFSARIKEVVIEEGVTEIGAFAFQNHKALSSVTLPGTVNTIGISSFALCNSLQTIELPESVTAIAPYAFYKAGLTELTVLSSDAEISAYKTTIPEETLIRGIADSTAQAYAERFNRVFVAVSDVVEQGDCGTDLEWSLYESGTVLVSGNGTMGDYTSVEAPWNSDVLVSEPVDGLTSVDEMFSDLGELFTLSKSKAPAIGTDGDNQYLSVTSSSAIFLSDDTDFLDNTPFEISFDLKFNGTSNGNAILSLNKRTGGTANEMRLLSEYNGYITFSGNTGYINLVSIADRTDWTPVKVVVYPQTYDYMVFIDNEMVLYTTTGEDGHTIYTKNTSGQFADSGVTMSQDLSPFANLSGEIDGIYFFHYVTKEKMIDNITVRTASTVNNIVVANGVENIGAHAFADVTSMKTATVAATVTEIGEKAFGSTALSKITILSQDVTIYDSADTIPATATIYGYSGSTAEAYATKYSRTFVAIN